MKVTYLRDLWSPDVIGLSQNGGRSREICAAYSEAVRAFIADIAPELWMLSPLAIQCAIEDANMGYFGIVDLIMREELGLDMTTLTAIRDLLEG